MRTSAQAVGVLRVCNYLARIRTACAPLASVSWLISAAYALFGFPVDADYNANMVGTPSTVATYAEGDYIYFVLTNQPTSHPGCNPSHFVIADTVPLANRQMMLAQLLAAKLAKEAINIGYDNSGDCAHGYIRVHRVG